MRALSWVVMVFLAWTAFAAFAGSVRADDFERFQQAYGAYTAQQYTDSIAQLTGLVAANEASPDARPLVLESLKYLAASHLFLGHGADAARTFQRLLSLEPDYVLDPLAFPEEVQVVFARVKARMDAERHSEAELARHQREESARATAQKRFELKVRIDKLYALAQTETVEHRRSRWVAMVPFGAGQFQNGDSGLGLILAVSEGALLAASIGTFWAHESLRDQKPAATELDRARRDESTLRVTNQLSISLFAVLAVVGVVDAQLRFEPKARTARKRELPPDLRRPIELGLSGDGLGIQGTF